MKLGFDYCCFEAELCGTGEKAALTSLLVAAALGIPGCILCVESLKLLLPTLFCLLYALHGVISEAQQNKILIEWFYLIW